LSRYIFIYCNSKSIPETVWIYLFEGDTFDAESKLDTGTSRSN